MTLIDCPECGRQVSNQAESCPDCAFPIAANSDPGRGRDDDTQTIEATGKSYKAQMALGAGAMIVGVLVYVIGLTNGSTATSIGGATLGGTGLIVHIFGRAGAWWEHE